MVAKSFVNVEQNAKLLMSLIKVMGDATEMLMRIIQMKYVGIRVCVGGDSAARRLLHWKRLISSAVEANSSHDSQ